MTLYNEEGLGVVYEKFQICTFNTKREVTNYRNDVDFSPLFTKDFLQK